jgi:hypothetical protein
VALVRTDIWEERQPHSFTSQKTAFFIVTAVEISSLIMRLIHETDSYVIITIIIGLKPPFGGL